MFVSIKGRDYTWFRKALEQGDLATVRSTLVDLPPLALDDALSVALLICEREPENAERAAVRWLRKLFRLLVAGPLFVHAYSLELAPDGAADRGLSGPS